MEIFVVIEFLIIVYLIIKLVKTKKKHSESTSIPDFDEPQGKDCKSVTYSWKLDSARKTQLKGHLTLNFDPKEIAEQRAANPYAIPTPGMDNETCIKKMYYYMLSHPRTIMHVADIVKYINRECSKKGVGELDKLQFVLDFVQEPNVKYNYDDDCKEIYNSRQYIRFPDETLYDRHGDCDCKSFLAAALFHVMGYNVLFMMSQKLMHAAICIEYDQRWEPLLQSKKQIEDVTVELNGRKYVFCETTSDGFRIGGIAEDSSIDDFDIILELRA